MGVLHGEVPPTNRAVQSEETEPSVTSVSDLCRSAEAVTDENVAKLSADATQKMDNVAPKIPVVSSQETNKPSRGSVLARPLLVCLFVERR
ncbi:unnamed protein product [Ectocarpus sp. CCAP 1310/34]|nr:unnamed protein product [Ectocarpus sp. CCAP 1310/34]